MSAWKFTDSSNRVVSRTAPDGRQESCLVSALSPEAQVAVLPSEPGSPPAVVTMRQARLALLQTGMLAQVNAAVAAADEATKITWEFSSEVQRSNPVVSTLAAALSLTAQQLDDLFTLAATL
jgi:hypothetical protein